MIGTLAVVSVAVAVALVVFALSAVRCLPDPIDPVDQERAVFRRLARHPRLRRFLRQRLDRRTAGGLMLTVSLLATFVVALVTGLLFGHGRQLVRSGVPGRRRGDLGCRQRGLDRGRPAPGADHLGDTLVVVAALLVGGVIDFVQHRRIEVFLFLGVVIVGEKLIVNGLKEIVDRARPDVMPLVGWQGPSFPSGHAAAAAAVWPALALLLTRGGPRVVRAASAAAAALIAFAVAASRALLGVHWLTDVVAGLTIGYGWFLVCAVTFGGRAQRLGDPVTARPSGTTARPE
ncbi:MAG TPA: phosphatase PAP2 family protein [Nakamurella sp.]